ncbi:hypothetical protein Vadar_017082 [Vaccinium darrowii]|uniref:Uncharacterized protein n=1 Tax=Vaccinium darrowii TaxID=229202 RepID=A0ACB7Y7U0_9ERIC|nr:hypothetical protein Vadar_017082 [Vaccinium darrowii]
MNNSSGGVASNILVNHDFSGGLYSWSANTCDASLVLDGQGGNHAVVTNRTKRWQGLEQDITGKVSASLIYTVSARVHASGPVHSSDIVEATLRLESRSRSTNYL